MSWLPAVVPSRFEHDGIEFVPLTPALLEQDYAAVMRDIPMLRAWSGQDWPTPEFTIEENLVDVERHDREQRERVALTYSLLLDGVVQGCIYVWPFAGALRTRSAEPPIGFEDDVAVRGWLHARAARELMAATLAFLSPPRFGFGRLWWQTNGLCPEQLAACDELGLTEEVAVPGAYHVWMMRSVPAGGEE